MNNGRSDHDYLRFDPFDGDRDLDIRCRTAKLVRVRKPQKCFGIGRDSHGHGIEVGERARYETALVDGKWGSYYLCLRCMDRWLSEAVPK